MTDSASVFRQLDEFSLRLAALLGSRAAQQAPKVAQRLRAEQQLEAALETTAKVLNKLAGATGKAQQPLAKAARLAAGCEAIGDTLGAFGDGKSLAQVARLCGQNDAIVRPIVDRIHQLHAPLDAVAGILGGLPTADELTGLQKNLTDLADDFRALQRRVDPPDTAIGTANPSTTGGTQP